MRCLGPPNSRPEVPSHEPRKDRGTRITFSAAPRVAVVQRCADQTTIGSSLPRPSRLRRTGSANTPDLELSALRGDRGSVTMFLRVFFFCFLLIGRVAEGVTVLQMAGRRGYPRPHRRRRPSPIRKAVNLNKQFNSCFGPWWCWCPSYFSGEGCSHCSPRKGSRDCIITHVDKKLSHYVACFPGPFI